MLIGELSKKTGLSRDTIRYYEKIGLIDVPKKFRRDNNYKDYPQEVLNKLNLIIKTKKLGFTLNEIEEFLDLWTEEDASCENLLFTLKDKVVKIENQIAHLTNLKRQLTKTLQSCCDGDCQFEADLSSIN